MYEKKVTLTFLLCRIQERMFYIIYLILQICEAFCTRATEQFSISHQQTDENKHIHHLHCISDTTRRTHCSVSATAQLIPTLKHPVHVFQHLVCAIFVHPPRFAITLNCLHTY